MARCIRCDRCGKVMDEVPLPQDGARKTVELKITTTVKATSDKNSSDMIQRNNRDMDLCEACCFDLVRAITDVLGNKTGGM